MTVHHVVVGDPSHGVTRLALQLLRGEPATRIAAVGDVGDARSARSALPGPHDAPDVHLHLTDGLLGRDPAGALRVLGRGRRVTITLHDVPQRAEGRARWLRRTAIYAGLAAAADLVVVSSEHERRALRAIGVRADHVLPLPIDARRVPARPDDTATVGVLGWIHPGKGLDRLADALAATGRPATIVALGGVAAGHEDHAEDLHRRCAALGVGLRTTGYLDDLALLRAAARVRVPVCPHRHVSASGSIGSWMSAGRRPIVADGGYAREVADRNPGVLVVADDLAAAVAAAFDDPASTVLPAGLDVGPSTADAASAQAALLDRWSTRRSVAA